MWICVCIQYYDEKFGFFIHIYGDFIVINGSKRNSEQNDRHIENIYRTEEKHLVSADMPSTRILIWWLSNRAVLTPFLIHLLKSILVPTLKCLYYAWNKWKHNNLS